MGFFCLQISWWHAKHILKSDLIFCDKKSTEYYRKHSRCYKDPRSSFNSVGKILTPCQSPQRVRWLKKCIGMQYFRSQKSVCRTKNVALLVLHQLRFSRLQNFKEYEEFSTCRCYLGAALINRLKSMVHWTETDTFFIVAYLHLLSVSI